MAVALLGGVTLLRRKLPHLIRFSSTLVFVAIALVSLEAPIPLHSQTAGISHISGVVTDQTGAAIAEAEVVFTNGTFSARQVTDDQGEFVLSPISTDFGVVRVSAQGFQTTTQRNVPVDVASNVLANFQLQPGSVTQMVEA